MPSDWRFLGLSIAMGRGTGFFRVTNDVIFGTDGYEICIRVPSNRV